MTALDNADSFSSDKVPVRIPRMTLPVSLALAAALIVFGSLAARGFSDNGFRLASQNASRFACLVFFAAIMAGPLGRLIPGLGRLQTIARPLGWSFCASYGVYLIAVLAPNAFGNASIAHGMPLSMSLFVLFSACVTVVMALALSPRMTEFAGSGVARALLAVSAIYFWLCYTLMGLAYISHPHRPDGFYGLSVGLMILGLLVQFADSFAKRLRSRPQPA